MQTTDYKRNKFILFKRHINLLIKRRYPRKAEYEANQDKYQSLIGDMGDELYGRTFYTILKRLEEDIDKTSNILFKDYNWTKIENTTSAGTKLAQLISPITKSEAEIAEAAGIKKVRFSRVKNSEIEDLYAWEVYGLAKALGLKPSQLFEYFYGDGERPVIGMSEKTI